MLDAWRLGIEHHQAGGACQGMHPVSNTTHLGCKRVVQQRRRHIRRDEPAGRGHEQSCLGTPAAGSGHNRASLVLHRNHAHPHLNSWSRELGATGSTPSARWNATSACGRVIQGVPFGKCHISQRALGFRMAGKSMVATACSL